jgi:hypothetical protein
MPGKFDRTIGAPASPPARDAAIDRIVEALGVDRVAAAGVVDALVQAAAVESGQRVAESVVEPLEMALRRIGEAGGDVLLRARRELGGERG